MIRRLLLNGLVVVLGVLVASTGFAQTFNTADLQGTWCYHALISGDSPSQTPGWYWGELTLDSAGNVIGSTVLTDSLGNSDCNPGATIEPFNISQDGVVTTGGTYRGINE